MISLEVRIGFQILIIIIINLIGTKTQIIIILIGAQLADLPVFSRTRILIGVRTSTLITIITMEIKTIRVQAIVLKRLKKCFPSFWPEMQTLRKP